MRKRNMPIFAVSNPSPPSKIYNAAEALPIIILIIMCNRGLFQLDYKGLYNGYNERLIMKAIGMQYVW